MSRSATADTPRPGRRASGHSCLYLRDGAGAYRCQWSRPAGFGAATCVIVPSGRAGAYDEPGPESQLYDFLTDLLVRLHVGVIRFDVERRADLSAPASEGHIRSRTERLRQVLREARLVDGSRPRILLGMSLGVQSALHVASDPPAAGPRIAAVVLIGHVIDEPIVLSASIEGVQLVYGADDYVADVDPDGNVGRPVPPSDYAAECARLVRMASGATPPVHILPGLDHTLQPSGCGVPTPAAPALARIVAGALGIQVGSEKPT